jgi:predicted ArsR family transcriptional regulator
VVRAAHWYRAQEIVETWRASAHRLLHDLGDSEEARLEMRILRLLMGQANGLSVRSIYRALRSPRKPVSEALKALEQDGQVVAEVVQNGSRGRPSERYRLV